MSSKLELNIRSLIAQCEVLAKEDKNNWLLKKYIKLLDTMIQELDGQFKSESNEETTTSNSIDEYIERYRKLKELANYTENPFISVRNTKSKKSDINDDKKIILDDAGDSIVREINQIQNSKYDSEIRRELLGSDEQQNIRKRFTKTIGGVGGDGGGGTTNDTNMGQAMKYYGDLQEKIAEDMLSLTRNLKEQTETASKIIKRDTELVTSSTKLSDRNIDSLHKEANKLQEHSKRACKCWMWMMIAVVMMIFICRLI